MDVCIYAVYKTALVCHKIAIHWASVCVCVCLSVSLSYLSTLTSIRKRRPSGSCNPCRSTATANEDHHRCTPPRSPHFQSCPAVWDWSSSWQNWPQHSFLTTRIALRWYGHSSLPTRYGRSIRNNCSIPVCVGLQENLPQRKGN